MYYRGKDGVSFLVTGKHRNKIKQYIGISERLALTIMDLNKNIKLKTFVYAQITLHDDEDID